MSETTIPPEHYPSARGYTSKRRSTFAEMALKPGGRAEDKFLADSDHIQKLWAELSQRAPAEECNEFREDYSESSIVLMAGRTVPPEANRPVYWAVSDNRVHFSVPLDTLTEQDRMLVMNQVLITAAERSDKNDVSSAAIALSQRGYFYIARNTQEPETMEYDKECAENSLTRVVKQLGDSNDKIAHMYVMGGLKDGEGRMRIDKQLLGMCARCVETVSPVMAKEGKVTIIPGNNGTTGIQLRHTEAREDVKDYEAWQLPYAVLKEPSIIQFSPEAQARADSAFEAMRNRTLHADTILKPFAKNFDERAEREILRDAKRAALSIPFLEYNNTDQGIEAFTAAQFTRTLRRAPDNINHIAGAIIEINDHGRKRFVWGCEPRGDDHNAAIAPVALASFHAALPRPDQENRPFFRTIYVTGYNKDGSPLNFDAGQWDRALKRAGVKRAGDVKVVFMSLTDGSFAAEREPKTLKELLPTLYAGSKQERNNGNGEHACAHC